MNLFLYLLFCFVVSSQCLDYNWHIKSKRFISIVPSTASDSSIFKAVNDSVDDYLVKAIFAEGINKTGWGHLSVYSSDKFDDEIQAYYSGVAEGIITRYLIEGHWYNTYENYCKTNEANCQKLYDYLSKNVESMIVKSRNQGGFWKMVRLMLWQIKGIQDAYDGEVQWKSVNLTETYLLRMKSQVLGLFILQADGDLSALAEILGFGEEHSKLTLKARVIGDGSCSAFFKYVNGSIYASHVTWSVYNMMLRLTKFYEFPYRMAYSSKTGSYVPSTKVHFSSYPGVITSIDDFYVTSGGLVTIETTNGNYNKSLFDGLQNKADKVVLEFFRVQTANRLSKNGPDWIKYFSMFNSGTYNNQWMILNNNLMKNHRVGDRIPDQVLYIAEQIPTMIKSQDVTEYLRTSFWSSFNIPFNKEIYKISGFENMAKQYGNFFTHDKAPRALIFNRDGPKVKDWKSLVKLMRYNDYKHDPLAKCQCTPPYSGENGISARCDLNPINGTYPFGALGFRLHGGTDLKFTNTFLAESMGFVAQCGPTYDQQPVFDWSKIPKDSTMNHRLHPITYKFPLVLVLPLKGYHNPL